MSNASHMSSPLVSIIIPAYNQQPHFLREAVQSALGQSYGNIEVIVSDNHSTNDSIAALNEIHDPRLRIIKPPLHMKMLEHFIFAGDQAQGEFLSFLASDDWVYPNWLDLLLPMLITCPEASFGFGEMESVPLDHPEHVNYFYRDNKQPTGIYPVEAILPLFMRLNRASGWFVGDLIRVNSYRRAGGLARDPINYSGDYSLGLRLLELGGKVVYMNKPVGKHRVWENQDGKVDASRAMAAIEDTRTLIGILEQSDLQRLVGNWFLLELQEVKKHKATLLTLLLLQAIANREVSPDQINAARTSIQELSRSPVTMLLLSLCNPKLNSILKLVHPYALRLIRTRSGRKLLD